MKGGLEAVVGGATEGLAEGLTGLAGGMFWACRRAGAESVGTQNRRARASRLMRRIVRLRRRG